MEREVLGVKEVAELFGDTPQAIRMRVYRGLLPARRLGGKIVFLRKELEEFLRNLPKVQPKLQSEK